MIVKKDKQSRVSFRSKNVFATQKPLEQTNTNKFVWPFKNQKFW